MTLSTSSVLAHGVLSSSSAWAIWETKDYVFAPFGFLLYFINGVLGLIAYVAGKSEYGNLLLLQNAIQNGYLPLIAAQVADITGSSIHTKMILLLAAIVSIIASPRSQGTSSISDHLKVISFFVVVFQWDVRSSLWWIYVTLLYLVFFVFEVVVPAKILNNPKVFLPMHSTFIVTANMCLTDLIKTQQK
uniref:ATP-dependent protease ATPase subunit HslU n=2 Tax=Lygus hesperus TaxID=30085 RepID=A0A0A9YG94_LYGHE